MPTNTTYLKRRHTNVLPILVAPLSACAREGGMNCNADGSYYVESESDEDDYDNGDDWLSFSYYG